MRQEDIDNAIAEVSAALTMLAGAAAGPGGAAIGALAGAFVRLAIVLVGQEHVETILASEYAAADAVADEFERRKFGIAATDPPPPPKAPKAK
jgi:hypothetical protein